MLDKLRGIKCFVLDIDGVLTDGTLIVMPGNQLIRTMHVKDGYALQLAVKKWFKVIVISGGNAPEVKERLEKLGITDVFLSVHDKLEHLKEITRIYGYTQEEILCMGDDIPDIEILQYAGVAACPSDAVAEVQRLCHYISPIPGGKGCVRDIIEKTMKIQGVWTNDTSVTSK